MPGRGGSMAGKKGWRTVVLMDSEKFAYVRKCRTAASKK